MKLRSIELVVPRAAEAAAFLTDIWGMAPAEVQGATHYLRGSGAHPYLIAIEEGADEHVRSTTFVCSRDALGALRQRVENSGLAWTPTVSTDPGGGDGLIVELPEGELFRFLVGTTEVAPIEGRDLPVKLTHVVLNAADAEASARVAEDVLGFRVSDRTKGMVFVRCNESHHSTAFARAGFSSLNHIAFEMADMDAVMRGIGRLRDHELVPAWGPGRHGPGANVFAYFIAPFGAVVEFSTAVEKVGEDYRAGGPEDWTWPEGRIDQWGISNKDVDALRAAEQRFRFRRDWHRAGTETRILR
ncbi:VOC family protein [Sphingosinicella sp. BN140058]|uniref:VOC family protein n=1 Tax=Sphingosinicella sp. BN140058 TaxID=1892855 RepID=UPI0010107C40|nr:VOC family protein [Sphingosinicella sp. BN140058]QAY78109.1 glyoxalase [Sphingosinicella sp. BN140058]